MHILHKLVFILFLRYWLGEFVYQSRASLVGDRFLYYRDSGSRVIFGNEKKKCQGAFLGVKLLMKS